MVSRGCIKYLNIELSKVREICEYFRYMSPAYRDILNKASETLDKAYELCREAENDLGSTENNEGKLLNIEMHPNFESIYLSVRRFMLYIDALFNIRSSIYRSIIPLLALVIAMSIISYIIYISIYIESLIDILIFGAILSLTITVSASIKRYVFKALPILIPSYIMILIHTMLYSLNIYMIATISLSIAVFLVSYLKLRKINVEFSSG